MSVRIISTVYQFLNMKGLLIITAFLLFLNSYELLSFSKFLTSYRKNQSLELVQLIRLTKDLTFCLTFFFNDLCLTPI